jgi:hypothetical protein
MPSRRWKALEEKAASVLGGRRINRVWFEFEKAPDVLVPDFNLIVDAKAYRRFSHHGLLDTIREKYCQGDQVPALVTKAQGQRGEYVTVPMDFLGRLFDEIRQHRRITE